MAHYLVIVESPAKVKTIKKFLGSSYTVAASNGHVRDLPKSQLGVDPENDFEPKYITIRGKGDILANLRKEAKKADKVFLATDPDREGEAISWHLAQMLGLHPLLGIQIGTGALAGGVGTTSAFGPVYEGMGAVGATEIGVSAATVGMILGSLTGGPLAVMLIKRYKLKADPQDGALQAGGSEEKTALDTGKLLSTICMITIIAACGIPIYMLLSMIPYIEMPYFIGCLFAGAIARNILEAFHVDIHLPEVETVEHISLDIFLAITIMTMDLSRITNAVGPMLIILFVVTIATLVFTYFIGFRMYHGDYNAACMCAGLIGMGMGSGSNAVANERAVMDKYGYSHIAWILYPAFSVLCVDIFNPLFMSLVPGFLGLGG